jgi:hypothetical protein
MQKKSLFAVFLLVSGLIIGCKKPEISSTSSNSGKNDKRYITMSDTLTPGEAHNAIVEEYYNTYGIDTIPDTVDYNTIRTIVIRTSAMFLNNAGLDPEDLNYLVDNEMAEFWNMGLFRPDSTVIEDSFKVKLALSLPNGGVRTAWLSIISGNEANFNDHYHNAETTLAALTGLTQEEREINDGSLSVLGSSYVLFSGLTTTQKAQMIADADAMGFAYGLDVATHSWWGWNPTVALAYAHHMSAKLSIAEAAFVMDK